MIDTSERTYGACIEPVLGSLRARSVRVKPGHWLVDGSLVLSTSLDADDWLAVEGTSWPGAGRFSPWELARASRALPWPARLALGAGGREQVRADLALGEANGHLADRLESACTAVEASCAQLEQDGNAVSDIASTNDAEAAPEAPGVDLQALCHEAGWRFADRADGRLVVSLDVSGAFVQAAVTAAGKGVRISIELLRAAALGAESRDAIGLLLLAVSRVVRSVRPSVSDEPDGAAVAWLDIELEGEPTAAMLDRALSCLSMAAAMCVREVEVLVDSRLARDYLAAQACRFSHVSQPAAAAPPRQARNTDPEEEQG